MPSLTPLPRLTDERAYLYGIIRTIGSGPDLRSMLSGVVRLTTEATQCHACLIWFLEGDRLVLRASSAPYAPLAGEIEMGLDEGLVGWVARSRRSAVIEENALADPRVKYFPELDEEHFQSLVSVPMFDRDGDVMGVISLHAEAPHEFARDDLEFLEHTASLIAGAVENARLYEQSTARVDLLTELSRLSRRISAASELDEVLSVVGRGTRELLSASSCELFLTDGEGGLELAAADPPHDRTTPLDTSKLGVVVGDGVSVDTDRLARALWGKPPSGSAFFEPLTVGDEQLGWLAVVVPAPPPGAATVLSAIAAHAAVAIRQLDLVERLLEKNLVSEFFQAVSRRDGDPARVHTLAARLEVDLDAPHVVVVASRWEGSHPSQATGNWTEAAARVESLVGFRLPGAWFDRTDHAVRLLVPAPDGIEEVETEIAETLDASMGLELSVGISDVCMTTAGYPAAFDEAAAAAEIGGLLRGGPGTSTFRDLGAYRYLLRSPDLGRDADRRRLDRLVDYDRRRGTTLLGTLERYLDERGNVVGTARGLYIHPNTLRQRLERIERETGLDLERDDWLSLAIAVKVVRLEEMRHRSDDGRGTHGS
ncbi:MAG TPA: GAF domain-containing protein [Actinomycetota bacterium]|nr:GAF domain-containing protein [Actinomycetota bacterium]